jgi:hypothetical protein
MDELAGTENRIAVRHALQRAHPGIQHLAPTPANGEGIRVQKYPFFQAPPEAKQVPNPSDRQDTRHGRH